MAGAETAEVERLTLLAVWSRCSAASSSGQKKTARCTAGELERPPKNHTSCKKDGGAVMVMEGAVCVFFVCVALFTLYEKSKRKRVKRVRNTRVKSKRKRAFVSSFFF
jgi:hypothetical protein